MTEVKNVRAGGMATALWWIGIILLFSILLLYPIGGLISDILNTINENKDLGVSGENNFLAKQIMGSVMAIFIILLVVFTPSDKFHSPLRYAWMHTMKGADDLTNGELYKNDPDKLKELSFEVIVFGLSSIGIFGMYLFLISDITNLVGNNPNVSTIGLIGLLLNVLVIAGLNSMLISILKKHEPEPIFFGGQFQIEDVETDKQTGGAKLLWGIALLIANIVILSIGFIVKSTIEDKLINSKIGTIIEGEAQTIDDILPAFR